MPAHSFAGADWSPFRASTSLRRCPVSSIISVFPVGADMVPDVERESLLRPCTGATLGAALGAGGEFGVGMGLGGRFIFGGFGGRADSTLG